MVKVDNIRIKATYNVYKKHLNRHDTLFGGYLLFWLDDVMGMTIRKYTPTLCVTASIDSYQFLDAVYLDEIVTFDCYISHVGNKSVEMFTEISSYNAYSRRTRLVGLAFSTFAVRRDIQEAPVFKQVEYNNELEQLVVDSFEGRKNNKISIRDFSKEYVKKYHEINGD